MENDFTYFITFTAGTIAFILAVILACVTTPGATANRHHRYARDLHGRVTCEYCKELMKGVSHEQH